MAQLPNVPGHDRVAALLEVARGQIRQQDFHAAIKTAREALSVDGAPPTLRNITRVKLGVALLGIGHNEEALRELERCDREWTTSVEGTRLKADTMKGDKEVLDTCLKRLRQLRANSGTADPLLSKEYTEMRQTWDRMTAQKSPDGKALYALAMRMRRHVAEELTEIRKSRGLRTEELLCDADRRIFEAQTCCAVQCVDAGLYQAAIEHAEFAIEVNENWGHLWEEKVVIVVLNCQIRAFLALEEHSKYVDVAKRQARGMAKIGRPGHEQVDALCEVVAAQTEFHDYVGAVATAREAVAVDAPPVSRQYARLSLAAGLMKGGNFRDAKRELELCDREWTTSTDGTRQTEADVAQMRQSLDHNLSVCRLRMRAEKLASSSAKKAAEKLASSTREVEEPLVRLMGAVVAGDFDGAAGLAENAAVDALTTPAKRPPWEARAFTLANCFLLDDNRAARVLACAREALELCKREPLDDACPICLQNISWPVIFEEGSHVVVHGLKKATHRNGDEGVVERASVGPDRRVQVRFCKNAAPEEGVLTNVERKAVLRAFQQGAAGSLGEVCRAAEASLGAPEGSLDQDAVDEVIDDVIKRATCCHTTKKAVANLEEIITREIARLEVVSSTYSLRIRSANLKASKGYVEASRRALITGCMHVYHARCIKRAVDEGQRTCPVCGDSSHFAETLVECGAMPSWDRPSWCPCDS